ncbi:Butyryl-CoA dehydrogenase [Mycolicibacterium rhodesiae JS60]|nr:Butyryl-CoA dehydrogenase [Mycolicibacterium rhodesiae JS60]
MSTEADPAVSSLRVGDTQLVPSEDQRQLGAVLRDFLDQRSTEAQVRLFMETESGVDEATWAQMAEQLGICGLAVPESLGGAGGTFGDVAVVLEELGRALTCVPYFSSVVLAQSLLLACDDEPTTAESLAGLASGSIRGTVAFAEPGAAWNATGITMAASETPQGWRLSGVKSYVIDGHSADVVFVVAQAGAGLSVFAVDADAPGLRRVPLPTMDLTRKQSRLEFSEVSARLVGHPGQGRQALDTMLDLAVVALCAESVGGAQRVLEMSVDYAKSRYQFGRPIGSFQAIKHKCADMLLAVESARSAAYYARTVAANGWSTELPIAASMAKSVCGDAYFACAAENIQVHGGIGFTWEHPAHLYFKRAKADELMFGDPVSHRSRLADLLEL